jgi:hypothetical protein
MKVTTTATLTDTSSASTWTPASQSSLCHRLAGVGPHDDHAILPRAEVAAVHEAGRTSWQISTDQPQPLVIGLFIRDVAGVSSRHSWLPPASPAVPRAGDQAPRGGGAAMRRLVEPGPAGGASGGRRGLAT